MYLDTKKIPTIGYGFNLTRRDAPHRLKLLGLDHGLIMAKKQTITKEQGVLLMEEDVSMFYGRAIAFVPHLHKLPTMAAHIFVDFIYNGGVGILDKFPGFFRAFRGGDWATCGYELMYRDVGRTQLTAYFFDPERKVINQRALHHVSAFGKLHKDRKP